MEGSLHEYVIEKLDASKGTWPSIARELEIPYGTLKKIATRASADPGITAIEKLVGYFRQRETG